MKRFYNAGSYLRLTVCVLSLTGFSGDLSARSISSYGEAALQNSRDLSAAVASGLKKAWHSSERLSEVKDALRKGVSVRVRALSKRLKFRALSKRVKSRFGKNQPTWTTLQALVSARDESEGVLASIHSNKFKKKHIKRLGRMASLKKIEGMDNPYRLSIAEYLARNASRGAQAKGKKILRKIASKPTYLQQRSAIKLFLESGDDKLVQKGHKAQQTILKQPNDVRFVDVSIYYFKWASQFPGAQEEASANLKQLLMAPGTSSEIFQRIIGEIKGYHYDFRRFIHEQFAGKAPCCAEVLKDNEKNSIMRDFLEKEKRKEDLFRSGNSTFCRASDSFLDKINNGFILETPASERDWKSDTQTTTL